MNSVVRRSPPKQVQAEPGHAPREKPLLNEFVQYWLVNHWPLHSMSDARATTYAQTPLWHTTELQDQLRARRRTTKRIT